MRTVRIGVYGFLVVWLFSWATQLQAVQFLVLDQYGPLFILGVLLGTARDVPTLRANGPALLVAGTLAFWTLLGRTGGNGWPAHSQVLLAVFLLVLPVVVILWTSLRSSREPRAPRLHRWVAIGALMTYPIYLLHNEFGVGIVSGLVHAGIAPRFAHAGGITAVLLLSLLSVLLFEPWARARLRRLFGWTVTDSEVSAAPRWR